MMASIKSYLLALAAVLVVGAVIVHATNFEKGQREPNDELVCSMKVDLNAKEGVAHSKLKKCNVKRYDHVINYIEARDLGSGGEVTVVKGDVGEKSISLEFKNEPGTALRWELVGYSKKKN